MLIKVFKPGSSLIQILRKESSENDREGIEPSLILGRQRNFDSFPSHCSLFISA
jgi:hypothetical protein